MRQSKYIRRSLFLGLTGLIIIGFSMNASSGRIFSGAFQDSTESVNSDSLNLAEGKKLYRSKCRRCHALYDPGDYKLRVWKENLDEMKYKAGLNKEEYEKILFYLKAKCKK